MRKIIITVLMGLTTISCLQNYKNTELTKVPSVNIDSLITASLDTSFYLIQKSIPLETVKSSVIGNIDGLRLDNDTIYILDKRNNSIILFNMQGDFLIKINQTGRGPAEYLAIMDFFIKDNNLFILDVKKRIIILNKQGKYVNTIKLPFRARYCELISDSKIAFQNISFDNQLKYSVGIYDINKEKLVNTIEVIKNVNDENYPFMIHKHLFKSYGGIYYNNDYSNIIYKIDTTEIKPAFQFFSKTFPSMVEILNYNKNPIDRQKDDYKRVFHLSGIFEIKRLITFSFFQNTSFRVIYNKEKKSFSCFKHTPTFLVENNGTFLSVNRISGKNEPTLKTVPNPIINVNTLLY